MASNKEINITAKIANIQKIRDELSKVKVNIKVESKELDSIMKMAQKGLKIPVTFDVKIPSELKQIMKLQKKGITIKGNSSIVGASPSTRTKSALESQMDFNAQEVARYNTIAARVAKERRARTDRELKRLFSEQSGLDSSFSPLVNGVRPGSFSSINPSVVLKRQKEQERILRAQQRMADNLEKANEYVRNNPLDALLGTDTKTVAAKRFGVSRNAITSRANFFDPKRIFQGENFREILFTSLLGGPGQGVGAALGAATFDKGGTLIGANIAAATIAVFERIAGAMGKTVQAGIQYERTVTGITGIFQATSQVIDKQGNPVGIGDALKFQRGRAENIQSAAQRALLPFGISGDAASALTKSFTAGLAQRGIAPDEKTTETVIRRLGAAINTLQPELANDANALQRTVEDIIGGSPQATRTELGAAIKGLAPGLFTGGAKTNEDIVKATDSLEALVVAIKNNDTASVQWQRALGTLQLAQQEVGKGILEGVAPAMKALADELSKPELVSGLEELGKAIGEAAANIINVLIPAIKGITKAAASGTQTAAGLSKAGFQTSKAIVSGLTGDLGGAFGAAQGAASEVGNLLFRRQINLTGEKSNPLLDRFNKGFLGKNSNITDGLTTRPSLGSLFSSAKTNFGIEDPSIFLQGLSKTPENSLRGLQGLRTTLRSYDSGRSPKDLIEQSIGLNSQEIGLRRQVQGNKNELFDSSESGQLSRALSEKGSLRDVLKLAEDNVAKRKQLLTIASTSTDSQIASEEEIAKARLALKDAENEVIKIRKETLEKEREIAEKRVNLLRRSASSQDPGTVSGRFAALGIEGKANRIEKEGIDQRIKDAQRILSDPLASPQDKANARNALTEENINSAGNASREADRRRRQQKEQFSKDTSGLRNNLRTGAFQDSQRSADLGLKQLDISTRELTLEQEKLAKATRDANKALSDFSEQSRLRELGRQGEEISAAEAIVAAGGIVPGGVDASLVRGSDTFDPEARAAFERRLAEERFGVVRSQNQFEVSQEGSFGSTAKALKDNITGLGLEKERQDLKPEEFKLQKNALLRSKVSNALSEEQSALEEYQNDPTNPELKAAYFRAKEAREAIQTSLPALSTPQGPSSTIQQRIKQKAGSFSINGEPVIPDAQLSGLSISSGLAPNLIASNDIGNSILSGISGSAYGKARESTAGAKAIGEAILNGLGGKDGAKPLREPRERDVNGGKSIFDDVVAKLPSKQDMQDAFSAALQQQFV